MGKKAKDKENHGASDERKSGGSKRGPTGAAAAPKFSFPQADRTVQIFAPAVLPPPLEGNDVGEEADGAEETDAGPAKVQLNHLPLLKHPVFISAIDNFLSQEECCRWIDWGLKTGFEEAKQKQTAEMAFRDNGRIEFESEEIAQTIWLRLRPFVPEAIGSASASRRALGCSPRIRVYRYVRGQRFGQHVDGSRDEPSLGGRTHFTVLVYLNGGDRDLPENQIKGGETVFWKDRGGNPTTVALSFPPTRGMCMFHGHGDECMIHEGATVLDGVKYVLRTDAVYEHDA